MNCMKRCVGVDVVRAGGVKAGVAAGGDMDHRRDVPARPFSRRSDTTTVGQRRPSSAAGGIGIEVDADEAVPLTHLSSSGMQVLGSTPGIEATSPRRRNCRGTAPRPESTARCRSRPCRADAEFADVMGHGALARAEDGEIAAAFPHQLLLVLIDPLAKLICSAHSVRATLGAWGGSLIPAICRLRHRLGAPWGRWCSGRGVDFSLAWLCWGEWFSQPFWHIRCFTTKASGTA